MTRSRTRRAELRESLRRRRERASRRRRWWVLLLLLLLLLLAIFLCCGGATPPPDPPPDPPGEGVPTAHEASLPDPAPPTGRIERRDRPEFGTEPAEPLAWIASFRLQVGARGPRLAECFVGAPRPGALKWTTSVEPLSGHVSDHVLEPTLQSDPLTSEQRACVLGVLSDPPYRLEAGGARSTPSRVGMAIEF